MISSALIRRIRMLSTSLDYKEYLYCVLVTATLMMFTIEAELRSKCVSRRILQFKNMSTFRWSVSINLLDPYHTTELLYLLQQTKCKHKAVQTCACEPYENTWQSYHGDCSYETGRTPDSTLASHKCMILL